jgi:DNA-binding response OmpR family regulator
MITSPTTVLLVEDDKNLGYILSEYLGMKGLTITWAKDGQEALTLVQQYTYALCILDINLPSVDGFTIAEKISTSNTRLPFIFLTGKGLKVDKLKAFKPPETPHPATIGNTLFNPATQSIQTAGQEYTLTGRESAVLELLILHKNGLLNREMALKQIWGSNDYFNRRSMDVIISKLRKHLATDPKIKIINVHGKGYMLKTPD